MKVIDNTGKYAFVVLKPDALKQFLDVNILQELLKEDLEVIKRKTIKMTENQVATVYKEKRDENYYPLLEKFLTESPSMCLILESTEKAIEKAQEFKDEIRENFKVRKFEIFDKDLNLLREGRHPLQKEITQEMAIENLIHVADNFKEVCENIDNIFTDSEIKEIRESTPILHELLTEYRQQHERNRELMSYTRR